MKNFYTCLEQNAKWETELDILKQYSNLVEKDQVIAKSACYYPRLSETKKRGRIAFIELYKKLCVDGKTQLMNINDFELFICKHREWDIHIQPTDKWGMSQEWIMQTETNDLVKNYLCQYEYLCTPTMPSITIEEEKIDNVSAIKNLANNLTIKKNELMQLIKYFLEELEQLSLQDDSP